MIKTPNQIALKKNSTQKYIKLIPIEYKNRDIIWLTLDQAMQLGKSILDLATSEDLDELTLTFNSQTFKLFEGTCDLKEKENE